MSRVVVVGAGVGGLAAAVRLLEDGHDVTVLEAGPAPGGKAGRLERDGYRFDTGPSLLTMPWVFRDLLGDALPELIRVEPVTTYRFADGSSVELSADLPRALEALEAWSPGAGDDWARFLGVCASMWRASVPVLTGEPPWPPRRPGPGERPPDPRDLLRVRPWSTLRGLARSVARDDRLLLVIERFATYAGADPRRAPAALAVAGYVEHAFGAWHVRGGIHELILALARRVETLGGRIAYDTTATGMRRSGNRVTAVSIASTPSKPGTSGGEDVVAAPGTSVPGTSGGEDVVGADWVVWNGEAAAIDRLLGAAPRRRRERSLSGYVLMLGVPRRTGIGHHTIAFPRSYDAEFDDVFAARRPVRDPTLYVSVPTVTDPTDAPDGGETWFVLVNAPAGLPAHAWDGYDEHLLARLRAAGLDPGEVEVRAVRSPADLERETGAAGGAIYGDAPHGRLGTLGRPGPRVRGAENVLRAGGTAHPGGGLPLVALSGMLAARIAGAG